MRNLIHRTYRRKRKSNWDAVAWAIDIHDTCIVANYKANDIPTEFFPLAKEVLKRLSDMDKTTLILFTCSFPHEIEQYKVLFKTHGIQFKHVNKNPDAKNTAFGCFDDKFYFNILLEDKADFDPQRDWLDIMIGLDEVEAIDRFMAKYPQYVDINPLRLENDSGILHLEFFLKDDPKSYTTGIDKDGNINGNFGVTQSHTETEIAHYNAMRELQAEMVRLYVQPVLYDTYK